MRVVLLIAVLLTFNAPAVGKVFRSGESLYSSCKSPFLGEKGECMGFILGIAEAFDGSSSGLWGHSACIPRGILETQVHKAVFTWLKENQYELNEVASKIVAEVLSNQWPCK